MSVARRRRGLGSGATDRAAGIAIGAVCDTSGAATRAEATRGALWTPSGSQRVAWVESGATLSAAVAGRVGGAETATTIGGTA